VNVIEVKRIGGRVVSLKVVNINNRKSDGLCNARLHRARWELQGKSSITARRRRRSSAWRVTTRIAAPMPFRLKNVATRLEELDEVDFNLTNNGQRVHMQCKEAKSERVTMKTRSLELLSTTNRRVNVFDMFKKPDSST